MHDSSFSPLTPHQLDFQPNKIDLQFAVGNPASDDFLNFNQSNFSFSESTLHDRRTSLKSDLSVPGQSEILGINAFDGLTPEQFFGSSTFIDPLAATPDSQTQLVVVDPTVNDWQQLIDGLNIDDSSRFEVIVMDPNAAGLEQVTNAVQRFDQLGAIHLISHGDGSGIQLGNERLTSDLSSDDVGQIASWQKHLSANADVLIYGCNLASSESGRSLVSTLGRLTGADVAASDDLTGSRALGGDWDLEFQTGAIEHLGAAQMMAQSNWQGYLGTVNITQGWLDSQNADGGPYYLKTANTNYVLQTDVTTPGTAFAIIARNVTFDLNGHTVTYNNSAPVSVTNHSFESGTGNSANNWTFSAGGTGERFQGKYLENTIYDGSHSLRFGIQDGDQHALSNGTVTLDAKTRYSLSSMMYYDQPGNDVAGNPGVDIYVRLESTTSDKVYEAVWDKTNWRGIQLTEKYFTTGDSSEQFRIYAGVRHDTAIANRYAIIDDIKIQKNRTYGVAVSGHSWAKDYYPGFSQYGWGHDATIKNGYLVQGQDKGTWSHGVFVHNTPNASVENVDFTVNGANTSAVYARDNSTGMSIKNNEFTSNVQTITSRDNFNAAVLYGMSGTVSGNTIHNGVHVGIYVAKGGTKVHDNTIRLKAKYTNAFAIIGGQEVYNNTIDNATGDYNSRGIGGGGGSAANPKKIYNNTINVQGKGNNQEYFGTPIGGAYGIQAEGGGHLEIFGNTVNVVAGETEAYAFRMNESTEGSNIYVHDNTFRATRTGSFDTAPVRLTDVVYQSLRFENNVLESNDQFVGHSASVDRIELKGSTLKAFGDTTGFKAVESFNWQGNDVTSVKDLLFTDTSYADAATRQLLVDSPFHNFLDGTDYASSFISRFNTTFRALDGEGGTLANKSIKVFDKDNQQVFSGTTDAQGFASTPLDEFRTKGANKTSNGPFTVRLESNGETEEVEFRADAKQTIDVQIGGGGGANDDQYSFDYNGSILDVIANDTDDHFVWSAADPLVLTIDGKNFDLQPGISRINLFGRGGNDSVTATGSSGDDSLIAVSVGSLFQTQAMDISFNEIEDHDIYGGSGGLDVLNYGDSAGNDQVNIRDQFAAMASSGWNLEANGFEKQFARATQGGVDSVVLSTAQSDSTMIGNGDQIVFYSGSLFKMAFGFDTAQVTASGTGNRTFYNDSSLDDSFIVDRLSLDYTNADYSVATSGFQTQIANSLNGGSDSITLNSDSINGLAFSTPGFTAIINEGTFARANNFASLTAIGSRVAGELAFVRDSAGDDSYLAHAGSAKIQDSNFVRRFNGFTESRVLFTTGNDQSEFVGSGANDIVGGDLQQLRFRGDSFNHFIRGFDSALLDGIEGNDTISLLDSVGDDELTLTENGLTFKNSSTEIVANNFKTQFVASTRGGSDSVVFTDSNNDDLFISDSNTTIMKTSTGSYNRAIGFTSVALNQAFDSDYDTLQLVGSEFSDHFIFAGDLASVTHANQTREFHGVQAVFATWNSLEDTLDQQSTNYTLELTDSGGDSA